MKGWSKEEITEQSEALFEYLAKTQDLATVIACCAHGADEMSDKSKYLGAMRSAAEIVGERISESLSKLERLTKKPPQHILDREKAS